VSDEGPATLKKWVEGHGVRYPIVNAPKGLTTYDISGFPTLFTLDERGRLAQHGEPAKGEIEAALRRVRWLPDLGATPLLKSLRGLWEDGKFSDLDKKLTAAAADAALGADDKQGVERMRALFTAVRDGTQKEVEAAKAGPDYVEVEDRLREIEKQWSGMPLATAAKTAQAELRKDKRIKAELDAGRKLRDLLARHGKDKRQLTSQLQALIKKHPGTFAASQAQDLLRQR
jgi:hypothetical protein